MGNSNNLLFAALAIITGALIPVQAATNAAFSKSIGNPYITALSVFSIGLASIIVFLLATRTPLPSFSKLTAAPLFSYAGGLIVATYVIMITILTPRLGVGAAIGLIVTGQILCAVLIDHFGMLNAAVKPITLTRLLGMLLMIAGVYLVMKKSR
jgi:transporter family-2 protein